jgi:hypothetical protein
MAFTTPEVTAPVEAPRAITPSAATFAVGAVIGRSFQVWGRNLVAFSIVTLVANVPVLLLVALRPDAAGAGWGMAESMVSLVSGLIAVGALTYGVLESLRGGRVGLGGLLRSGLRSFGPIFAVSFRVGLWLIGGLLLFVIPAIVWYCGLYVAIPAVVVERHLASSADALARSRELTKGHRTAIFLVALVVTAVVIAGGTAIGVASRALAADLLSRRLLDVLATCVAAVLGGLTECASAVAYHDLRIAKEGVSTAELVKVFE